VRDLAVFLGQTTAGQPVQAHFHPIEYIDDGRELCLILRKVEVGRAGADGQWHDLSLTNLEFPDNRHSPIALTVSWGSSIVSVSLTRLRNYQVRIGYLTKTRGIVATAVLRFNEADLNGGPIDAFISDTCLALSLTQGRKINWIYHVIYGPQRVFQHAVFGENITKAYAASPLCFAAGTRTAVTPPLSAAEEAVPAIKQFRENFDPHNRLINAWLDARTETDYLEGRTLKYVVVVEALNELTTKADRTIARTVRDSADWKRIYREVVAAMPELAGSVTLQDWQSLNHRPFKAVLSDVCACHRIDVAPPDLKRFNNIRNNIVHRLNYDLKIKLPSESSMADHPQAAQHSFVANFVDRIVLGLFGLRAHLNPVAGAPAGCKPEPAQK
jgi:hypothetical protein